MGPKRISSRSKNVLNWTVTKYITNIQIYYNVPKTELTNV